MKPLIFLMFFTVMFCDAQINFQKMYSAISNSTVGIGDMSETADGGYIISGVKTGSLSTLLIKLNQYGDTIWTKSFTPYLSATSVAQTTDGGYILAGDYFNVNLTKTDSMGNPIWAKRYGDAINIKEFPTIVKQTADGGYVVASSKGSGQIDFILMRTTANGDTLWTKTYGTSQNSTELNDDVLYGLQITASGGFIMAGEITAVGGTAHYALIIKTDVNGNIVWSKRYGESDFDVHSARSLEPTNDGGYVIADLSDYPNAFFKIDSTGKILWTRNMNIFYDKAVETDDGNFALLGIGFSGLIKAKANGDTLWTRRYDLHPSLKWLKKTKDHGFILGGTWFDANSKGRTILIKTDENGLSDCTSGTAFYPNTIINDSGSLYLSNPTMKLGNYNPQLYSFSLTVGSADIGIEPCSLFTEVYEVNKQPVATLTPNIYSFSTTLTVTASVPLTLRICDLTGRVVSEKTIDQKETVLYRNNLPSGLYIFQLTNKSHEFIESGKFFIE